MSGFVRHYIDTVAKGFRIMAEFRLTTEDEKRRAQRSALSPSSNQTLTVGEIITMCSAPQDCCPKGKYLWDKQTSSLFRARELELSGSPEYLRMAKRADAAKKSWSAHLAICSRCRGRCQ